MTSLDRKELIQKLMTVTPALATREVIPQLSCYWFTGKAVMAYNDQIGISVPCETDFAGAVPGKTLIGLLGNSNRETVDLTGVDGKLLGKAGRSNFKLPLLPAEDFVFEMPSMPKTARDLGEDRDDLLACIAGCMRSLEGQTAYVADQMGLTLSPNDDGSVDFFATDSATISAASIEIKLSCPGRVLLPAPFCKQMLALGKGATSVRFHVGDHALMTADGVSLFGRLLTSEKPYDFVTTIGHHFPAAMRKRLAPMPKGFKLALQRAKVVCDKEASEFSVEDDYLRIDSKSPYGEVKDRLKFDATGNGKVRAKFEPERLLLGVDTFDQLAISDGCCIMTNDKGDIYLVAARDST